MSLVVDYGSLLNHHESPNVKTTWLDGFFCFQVRRDFQCANHNVLKVCIRVYTCTHTQRLQVRINIFKATKDIAAGQELLASYGSAQWFQAHNVSYSAVDYASTMWRPDLRPLPCRQYVHRTTGADGRPIFTAGEAMRSGTVLEISLCVEVSLIVVDQFPFLWDFVLTGETDKWSILGANKLLPPHTYTHRLCCCRSRRRKYRRTC